MTQHLGPPPSERDDSDKQAKALRAFQANPGPIDFKSLLIEDIALNLLHPSEEGDFKVSPEMVESLEANGNINPLLVCPHPHRPGEYRVISGHHRWANLKETSRSTARCMKIPFVVDESLGLELDMQLNNLQRNVKAHERAAKAERWLELNPDRTQKECAALFGCSPNALSRDLAEHGMSAEFKAQTLGLVTAVRQILMGESDPIKRKEAIDYALAVGANGKRPSRDRVVLFLKQNRTRKGRPPKFCEVDSSKGSFLASIRYRDDGDIAMAIDELHAEAKRLKQLQAEGAKVAFAIIQNRRNRPGGDALSPVLA